jgi:hypothetical protein
MTNAPLLSRGDCFRDAEDGRKDKLRWYVI